MRCLLDTHSFIWWVDDDSRLPVPARDAIAEAGNEIVLSVVSVWEIALLVQRARLSLDAPPIHYVPRHVAANGFSLLLVQMPHAFRVGTLPFHHRDPFDRMLVAQAQIEMLTLITGDTAIGQYDVPVIWD